MMARALLTVPRESHVKSLLEATREPALHAAAAQGEEEVCKALLASWGEPNLRDWGNNTPLHRAAEAGHHGVIGSLVLKGADIHATNFLQETPLHLAASKGHTLCISELFLGGADKDMVDEEDQTPLFRAAKNNHVGAVEELLAAGANRGIRADNNYSPFEIAAHSGYVTIVKAFFLEADSSEVHATDDDGYTALHCCVSVIDEPVGDNGDTVRVLLEAGADVDAKTTEDSNCDTPLLVAVDRRIAPIGAIRALLEGGANVNARDVFDQTPLHVACARSSVNGVEFLLSWGADEKLTDVDGETPADAIGNVDTEEETPPDVTDAPEDNRGKDEEIEVDNQRIRQMLARAPADRSWRRRRWLVLSRSCPTKVQISNTNSSSNISSSSSSSSSDGLSAEVVSVSCNDLGGDDKEPEDQRTVNWRDLVVRLVGLETDVLFRLVVGFV
ncbi:unnamed protein product [Ectocarpus sp. 12 AP-2014]